MHFPAVSVCTNYRHLPSAQGPPGVGKTTTILALARHMLGASFRSAVLELNASNERGIDVVRNKIKSFAQTQVTLPPGRHKIVILDEADRWVPEAWGSGRLGIIRRKGN